MRPINKMIIIRNKIFVKIISPNFELKYGLQKDLSLGNLESKNPLGKYYYASRFN